MRNELTSRVRANFRKCQLLSASPTTTLRRIRKSGDIRGAVTESPYIIIIMHHSWPRCCESPPADWLPDSSVLDVSTLKHLKHTAGKKQQKNFEKTQNKNIQISLSCVYRWRLLFFFFFLSPTDAPSLPVSGIFTASAEALLGQCVMEKYSRARGATASFLLLSGLGHVESKTMKDKAVSTGSVPQLRLSFISPRSLGQTADRSGCLWAPVQNH